MRSASTDTFVKNTFSPRVSKTYELVNRILTFGFDALWRRRAARIAAAGGGTKWADMCTGTGDMALCLSRLAPEGTSIHAVDLSIPMLLKAQRKPEARNILFVVSDVNALEFPDGSFDLVTISFATRNISLNRDVLAKSFAGFCRILKPGGLFVNLETSQPSSVLIRKLYHFYVRLFVKPAGGLISGNYPAYAYLAYTIPRFYTPEELSVIMREAGFKNVTHKKLLFGVAAIHQGTKG